MTFLSVVLAVSTAVSPIGPLTDDDRVVTNVDLTGVVLMDRESGELYEVGNTNRIKLASRSFSVTNGEDRAIVTHGDDNPRFVVSESSSGAQVYMFPTNGAFLWVPEDSGIRFGGKRNPDGSISGARTAGYRIRSAVDSATNGVVRLDSSEWVDITNKVSTSRSSDISITCEDGSYIHTYVISALGTLTKSSSWIHEVQYSGTSQAVISVEYPKYVFTTLPVWPISSTSGYWKGPFYKKTTGSLEWVYDSEKTSTDLIGYTKAGVESTAVRDAFFTQTYSGPAYTSAYTFTFNPSYTQAGLVLPSYNTDMWWQGGHYLYGAYLKLGGNISFIDALKGTNAAEYVGFGDCFRPNVESVYTNTLWYLDRSEGSGEYYTYTATVPYTWYETVTTSVGRTVYRIAVADSSIRFIPGDDLKYECTKVAGTDPWNLRLTYSSGVFADLSIDLILTFRGLNSDGNPVWSCHDDPGMWLGDPSAEYGTVLWDSDSGEWKFTGGLDAWQPYNGAVTRYDICRPVSLDTDQCIGYPCYELGATGTVKIVSVSGTQYIGTFIAEYSRSVPVSIGVVTNALMSSSATYETVSNAVNAISVPRAIVTNGTTYAASPFLLNGNILYLYKKGDSQ